MYTRWKNHCLRMENVQGCAQNVVVDRGSVELVSRYIITKTICYWFSSPVFID
jgi:hypothetical protein